MDDDLHFGAVDSSGNYVPASLAKKDTQYSCPDCNEPVKYTKPHIRSASSVKAYFSHLPNSECSKYSNPGESHFHKEAKRLISYFLDKRLITFTRKCMMCRNDDTVYTTTLTHTAKQEYMYEKPTSTNTADVALFEGPNMKLIVEINYTHKTEEWKRPDPWVELEAKDVLRKLGIEGDVQLSCIRRCKHECLACKLERKKRLALEAKRLEKEAAQRKKDAEELKQFYKQVEEAKLYKAKQELLDSQERLRVKNENQIEQPIVSQFNDSMTEKEKVVHALAAKMLKTRYNPMQCNLFRSFSAKQKSTDAKQRSSTQPSSVSKP